MVFGMTTFVIELSAITEYPVIFVAGLVVRRTCETSFDKVPPKNPLPEIERVAVCPEVFCEADNDDMLGAAACTISFAVEAVLDPAAEVVIITS
jgi:hypothetical protein